MAVPTFRLYDTMSKQVKPLATREPGHLRFYSCGPTVYSYAHIGNFRTFLTADLVVRTARALGWKVTYVSNITDVGHLTEDDRADAGGEDKMARALKSKEGEQFANVWDLAEHYAASLLEDWSKLNMLKPDVRPKATQHMREQILAIEDLIRTGHAYETPTGVYFSVESKADYGKLSGNTQDKLLEAVREVVADENKRRQADFALWKKDDKHLMQWFSPWGWGFPGWHLECSVMARAYLGDTIDLHGGGEDLVFPHHECEIAQSETLTGEPFCGHWIHTRFLQVDGEKMSKSKGNWYTVRDLVDERGADPMALRYALMSVPYGKPFNFTLQTLRDATVNVERFREAARRVDAVLPPGEPGVEGAELGAVYGEVLEAMCDDLNTSVAIAKALEGARVLLRTPSLDLETAKAGRFFLGQIEELLGFVRLAEPALAAGSGSDDEVEGRSIEEWIALRAAAKAGRNFAEADGIRAKLAEAGVELRDGPEGTTWVRKALI